MNGLMWTNQTKTETGSKLIVKPLTYVYVNIIFADIKQMLLIKTESVMYYYNRANYIKVNFKIKINAQVHCH